MKKLGLVLLILFLAGCKFQGNKLAEECKQFTQDLAFESPYLEYVSCQHAEDLDFEPLTLSYRIKGEHTAKVEQQLIERFKLNLGRNQFMGLKKTYSVAGWEAFGIIYDIYDDYITVRIGFYSDDTYVDKRENWKEIPYFHLSFAKNEQN